MILLLALGCGGAPPEPPPPPPIEIVVPPFVLGTWYESSKLDGRTVLAWPCQGAPPSLRIDQTAPLRVEQGGVERRYVLQDARLERDGSARLIFAEGELTLKDPGPGQLLVRGSLPGFETARLFLDSRAGEVEVLPPIAQECGAPLPAEAFAALAGARFNRDGDPCAAESFSLRSAARAAMLRRTGLDLKIDGAMEREGELWLAVSAEGGRPSGMRLRREEGGYRLYQRGPEGGMDAEALRPQDGPCRR